MDDMNKVLKELLDGHTNDTINKCIEVVQKQNYLYPNADQQMLVDSVVMNMALLKTPVPEPHTNHAVCKEVFNKLRGNGHG